MMIFVIFPMSCLNFAMAHGPSPGVRSVTSVSAFTAAMNSRDMRQLGQAGPCEVQGAIQARRVKGGVKGPTKTGDLRNKTMVLTGDILDIFLGLYLI